MHTRVRDTLNPDGSTGSREILGPALESTSTISTIPHHPAPERSSEKEARKVLPRDPSLLKNGDARDFGNQAPRHDPRDGSVERTPARLHLPSQSMPRQDVPTTQILSQLLNALPRCPFGGSNFGYCVAS